MGQIPPRPRGVDQPFVASCRGSHKLDGKRIKTIGFTDGIPHMGRRIHDRLQRTPRYQLGLGLCSVDDGAGEDHTGVTTRHVFASTTAGDKRDPLTGTKQDGGDMTGAVHAPGNGLRYPLICQSFRELLQRR